MQRLATEPQGAHAALQVVDVVYLRGGVLADGGADVSPRHAVAIVPHAKQVGAVALDGDGYLRGVGVDAVLDEFLHRRGGPLDHLAGGDPLDCAVVEWPDHSLVVGHRPLSTGE